MDIWLWSARLTKTRSIASNACRGGHVRINDVRAKPAQAVRVGDEIRLRHNGRERIVIVSKIIVKRVSAPLAAEAYEDKSPPPPPRELTTAWGTRDRGAGRPTKRERREIERLMSRGAPTPLNDD